MSSSSSTAAVSSTSRRRRKCARNTSKQSNPAPCPAPKDSHAISADDATLHVPASKTKRARAGLSTPSVAIPTLESKALQPATLDSKSTPQDTRPKKSVPTVQEGSSSGHKDCQTTTPAEPAPQTRKSRHKRGRGGSSSVSKASAETASASLPTLDPSSTQSNSKPKNNLSTPSPTSPSENKAVSQPDSSASNLAETVTESEVRARADRSPLSVTVPAPESANAPTTTFDPRSILPDTKPIKNLSTLREGSSSGSKTTKQPASFRCIDGAVRTSNSNEVAPEDDTTVSVFDKYISSPEIEMARNTNRSPNEQFKAFGIEAFPTRALTFSICYDFVSFRRWCPHGSKCVRIHPLDKQAYLAEVIKDAVQLQRMKIAGSTGAIENQSREDPLSSTTSHVEAESVTDPIRVKLPPPNTRSNNAEASTSTSRQQHTTASTPVASSSDDVHTWDSVVGLDPRQRSSSNSASSNSGGESRPRSPIDTAGWDGWGVESSWSDDSSGDPNSILRYLEERRKQGTFMIANCRGDSPEPEVATPPKAATPPTENVPTKVQVHPRPRNSERCRRWLRNQCSLGYDCNYIHEDLEYDDDEPPDMPKPQPVVRGPEYHTAVLHDHMHLKVGPGFAVENISTGFESNVVFVANLPPSIPDQVLRRLLTPFGEIVDIRYPLSQAQTSLSVRVEFSKSVDAYKAFATLHGTHQFGRKLELRMAVETKYNGSLVKDTVVRIDWEYAHRTVYMGYASEALAEEAAAKASHILYDGQYQTVAEVYIGIPAVGKVTVKFDNLPPNVTQEGMKVFGDHQGMVTARSSYEGYTLPDNIERIKRLCKQFQSTMTDLEFRPAPYKAGRMRAWAYFASPKDAELAAANLHGRKPAYTGHTRIQAKHIKTISFSLGLQKYQKVARDVQALAERIWRQGPGYNLSFMDKNTHMTLRLSGENLRILGRLKSEVERTLNGEIVLIDGKVAWDDFFRTPMGTTFLREFEHRYMGVTVERDILRRTLRIFGHSEHRAKVRHSIAAKIAEMQLKKWHTITLDALLATALSTGPLYEIQRRFGTDNFVLDHWYHVLRVRGDDEMLTIVSDEVNALRKRLPYSSPAKKALRHECPVCLNEASVPVHLTCGHTFCRGCLKRYLLAAVDHKFFPLTCLGREGKCEERISLALTKELLPPDSFNAIVEAAFSSHVQTHPNEFHFCPTPDCQQIYRSAKEGVFIQCPSCLVRICPNCHSDAHDGLSCAEAGSGDDLFQEWAGRHGVKQCPNCKMGIEKDAGCNHMVCLMCKTHICWVCSETFPNGDGIYGHMRSAHGGIGLVDS